MQGDDTIFWNFKDSAEHQQYLKIHESLWRDVEAEVERFATQRAGQDDLAAAISGNHVWNDTVTRLYLEIGFEVAKQQKLSDAEQTVNEALKARIAHFFPTPDPSLTQLAQQLATKVLSKRK
jgi:hypothetical protein